MILKSDFTDYYDLYFDDSGPVFNRISKNTGPNKKQQFEILKSHGFLVPPHGTVGEILRSEFEGRPIDAVVAYTDINAHCGGGKKVFTRGMLKSNPDMGSPGGDRFWRERELFCSAFIGSYPKICTGGSGIRGSGVELYMRPHEVLEALEQSHKDGVWVQSY